MAQAISRRELALSACLRPFWFVLLLLPLIAFACGGGGSLSPGKGGKGETLIIQIEDINRVQEIRYQGTDRNHYLVVPASRDNELVALRLNVHNAEATRVLMTVGGQAAELRGAGSTEEYTLLDLTPQNVENVRVVDSTHPAENRFVPFIAGPIELPQGHSVVGWVVFEVPRGTKLREIRWDAGGDVIYIRG